MTNNSFDPRPACMPDSTKDCGSGPGSCAGSGDHPYTQAKPFEAFVTVVPAGWTAYSDGVMRLTALKGLVTAVDFYGERP